MYLAQYDLQIYIQHLHQYVERQNQRITQLEKTIIDINKELQELKQKPTTQIDRIEYKFDQLKVETLEGTLNIGLTPSGGETIEDFAVSQAKMNIPDIRHVHKQLLTELESGINQYLTNEGPLLINRFEEQESISLAEGYSDFIIEDIRKQIKDRITFYLEQHQEELQNPANEMNVFQSITSKVKTDIQNSISAFMKNIPDSLKERN